MDNSNNRVKISKQELEDKLSNVIMRQTNYTKEQAITELQKNNYSVKLVLMKAHNIQPNTHIDKTSSQERFKMMRQLLDR
jgi:N-acetylmuramic acid 6-phosphate (MurNAc-6-P) etherase